MMRLLSKSPAETQKIGTRLARYLKSGDIVLLAGSLGAGKTVLVKGIARGFGISPRRVTSSSFILMKEYKSKRRSLYHFDLYRINDVDEVAFAGFKEYLWSDGISVIEWADCFVKYFDEYLRIDIGIKAACERTLKVSAKGARYAKLIERFGR